MAYLVELNDAAVAIWDGTERLAASPGFATLDRRTLVLGRAAFDGWRANPRQTVNQFWQQLDTTALPLPAPGARTRADLAYRHLEQLVAEAGLADGSEVLFAVPGRCSHEHLALLLGIAGQLGLQATGLVDLAVARAAAAGAQGPVLVLDSHLHRTQLTPVGMDAGELQAHETSEVDSGRLAMGQALVAAVADQFVSETRFDPQHSAGPEQALWQDLPRWLDSSGPVTVELGGGGRRHRVEVAQARLAEAAAGYRDALFAAVAARDETDLLLTPGVARVPGLQGALQAAGKQLRVLDEDAAARAVQAHLDSLRSDPDSVQYCTRLAPLGGTAAAPAAARAPAAEPVTPAAAAAPAQHPGAELPSHLLDRHRAHPLAAGLALGGDGVALPDGGQAGRIQLRDGTPWLDPQGARVQLNGNPLSAPAALACGDRVEAGGAVFTLVQVLPGA